MDDAQQQHFNALTGEIQKLNNNFANQNKDQYKSVAPTAPSDDPAGKAGTPPNDNKFLEATRSLHEKVIGPTLAKQIAQAVGPGSVGAAAKEADAEKETSTRISDMSKNVMGSNKLLQRVATTAESDLKQTADASKRSQTEKMVKEKKQSVHIASLDDKASKQFGGMFGGLKKLFGGKKPGSDTIKKPTEDDGMGFWGWLGVTLLGFAVLLGPLLKDAIIGTFKIVAGLFLLPAKALLWAGGMLKDIVTGALELVWKGIKGIFKIGDWFTGGLLGKGLTFLKNTVTGWWKGIKGGFSKVFGGGSGKAASKAGAKGASKVLTKSATAATDDVVKGASKGITDGAKVGKKAAIKGALKGAARLAGPVAAVGFAAFDGIGAAMEEYEKSGSLLSAAKEGTAGALSGLTFGLVSQESISGAMTAIGDGVTSLFTDPIGTLSKAGSSIVGGAKDLLDSATSWLFGSPHATHYINKSGDEIHDGSTSLADSAATMSNATSDLSKSSKRAGERYKKAGEETESSAKTETGFFSGFFGGMFDNVRGVFSGIGDYFSKSVSIASEVGDKIMAGENPLKAVGSGILKQGKHIASTVSGMFSSVGGVFGGIGNFISKSVSNLTGVGDGIKEATDGAVDGTGAIKAAGDGVISQAEYILKLVGQIFKDVINPLESSGNSQSSGNATPQSAEDRQKEANKKKYEGRGSVSLAMSNKYRDKKGIVRHLSGDVVKMDQEDLDKYAPETPKKSWWSEAMSEAKIMQSQADPKLKKTVKIPDETNRLKDQKDLIDQNSQMIAKLDKICEYQQQQLEHLNIGNRDRREQTESVTAATEKSGGSTLISTNNNQAIAIPTIESSGDLSNFRSRVTSFA